MQGVPSIVFFGTEDFSLETLKALVRAGYTIALVVTKPDGRVGRGLELHEPPVKHFAAAHNIRIVQPTKLSEVESDIAAIENRIGVLSSYGKIVPESTLALFDNGIINIHPSLLPIYRGPSPIETAILNGDTQTGVSLMRLAPAMDAGPVYVQKTIELDGSERAKALYTFCAQTGSQLLIDSLPRIISGELQPQVQDESRASYTSLLNKKMSYVDPATQTAESIDRHIRAYEEFPRTRILLSGHDIIITDASLEASTNSLELSCANSTTLYINTLIAPSGKTLSGTDFARGYLK